MRTKRVDDAIKLYEKSRTGRGKGDPSLSPLAVIVAKKLRRLFEDDEIGIALLRKGRFGEAGEEWWEHDVRIASISFWDIASLSNVLVHEAAHLCMFLSSFEEEVRCRLLEMDYYSQLRHGIWLDDGRSVRFVAYSIGDDPVRREYRYGYYLKGQLIDVILNSGTYSDDLTEKWVRANIYEWGGIANRWTTSKGHFIRVLAKRKDESGHNASLILRILESIEEKKHWDKMLLKVGFLAGIKDEKTLRDAGLTRIKKALGSGLFLGSAEGKIRILEGKFGDDLLYR
jgi:hypothetical protein